MEDLTLLAKAVFQYAHETPDQQRLALIDRACNGNEALRERVERLWRAGREAGPFMSTPTYLRSAVEPGGPCPEQLPSGDVGPYRIVRRIGEGAFGEVYHAEQTDPVRRSVAIKVLRAGMDTRQVLARFDAERQALASLDHPNVARFLDAGSLADGRPYFVMELIRGTRLTDYADANHLPIRDRVRLLVGVCRGVQHAHDAGLIHRDLKPGNVLVEVRDDLALPRVIDFGIARAAAGSRPEAGVATLPGQVMGTPAYMSPEQSAGAASVDARTDVYSLGAMLYELLTGTTPIPRENLRQVDLAEAQRLIAQREIPAPSERIAALGDAARSVSRHRSVESSRLASVLRDDLDWVCLRALARDPAARYVSANSLADDLQRWLDGRVVIARPRRRSVAAARSSLRRHRRLAGRMGVGVAVVLLFSAGLAGWLPGVPGLGELVQRSVEMYARGSRLGLPEGAWVNGVRVNRVGGKYALVGGGRDNTASRDGAMVGGGSNNSASGNFASVGGGASNMSEGDHATVAGGSANRVVGHGSTVAGGRGNKVIAVDGAIGGGQQNEVGGDWGVVGGGYENVAMSRSSVVAGGLRNRAYDMQTTIAGGYSNRVGLDDREETHSDGSTVGGGIQNVAIWRQSIVAGGWNNQAISSHAFVGGGNHNIAGDGERFTGIAATVTGGEKNSATKGFAAVGGGQHNSALAPHATVPGGLMNLAEGPASLAAGTKAHARHAGSFVWSDRPRDGDEVAASRAEDSFTARARGGFQLLSGSRTAAVLRPGEGSWSHDLSLAARAEAQPADTRDVLAKVAQLDIHTFRYGEQEAQEGSGIRHIGPAADQFHALFGLGRDDGHVTAVDLDGVALAALKGLLERVEAQQALIDTQARRLDELERRLGGR